MYLAAVHDSRTVTTGSSKKDSAPRKLRAAQNSQVLIRGVRDRLRAPGARSRIEKSFISLSKKIEGRKDFEQGSSSGRVVMMHLKVNPSIDSVWSNL
jgi:hypothetical protein